MRNQQRCNMKTGLRGQPFRWVALSLIVFAASSAFAAQDSPAVQAVTRKHAHAVTARDQESGSPKQADLGEYGPLVAEFARVATKVQQGVQVPAPRTQSKLLPLLPGSTSVYFSVANYGDALYQANQIFNQEVHNSTVLSAWWQNKVGIAGMMVEAVVEQVHQFTGYLGDEFVIAGTVKPKGGSFLFLAEIKKPGLKAFLQQLLDQYGGKNAPVRIVTPQQLLTATSPAKGKQQVLLLVRPDLLVAASDMATLRSFNAKLNRGPGTFNSTPFGQRLAQAYQSGVAVVGGADLQQLLALRPKGQGQQQTDAILQQTGFGDVKYAILDGKYAGGVSSSNFELSFNGPRKGVASWLGAPTTLGGLDFVSPNAISAGAVVLKNPSQMFDDIKTIADAVNPMASMGLAQAETEFSISFKEDLFSKLGGQLAFALESPAGPDPAWKAMVQVSDADGLQKTIKQLFSGMSAKSNGAGPSLEQKTEGGLTYWSVNLPTGQKHQEVDYAFAGGYLVATSTPALLKEAIELHRSGNSLAKSSEFLKLLPTDHSGQASALIFQNTALTMASMAQQLPPEMAQLFVSLGGQNKFSVVTAYGEESSIRTSSNNQTLDVAVPLLLAAVAIPNLMRSKTAATEASAAATVRTLNTAEVTYQVTYPAKGFARDLATLGPPPDGDCAGNAGSEKHACLLDAALGCASETWCTKNGFQYSITATCDNEGCKDYVALGTPADPSKGAKSYCSTSDAVVRSKSGPPVAGPISAEECQTWQPL
jgi:type IV pilus assembly protein PilA